MALLKIFPRKVRKFIPMKHRPNVGMKRCRSSVNHSVNEHVRGMVHINGIESFWAVFKRVYQGTFHQFSERHLQLYISEFAGRHNARGMDTIAIMAHLVAGMVGRRLTYSELAGV